MNKYVYISPDSPNLEKIDELAFKAKNEDNNKILQELKKDEFVEVYDNADALVNAFNNEEISDLGYILTLNV